MDLVFKELLNIIECLDGTQEGLKEAEMRLERLERVINGENQNGIR